MNKQLLQRENDRLREEIREKDKRIHELKMDIYKYAQPDRELNLQYMLLMGKYNKLLDSCLSKETEHITYNGDLYDIKSIDYHKDVDSVDTLNIEAVQIPSEKGLINNLAEPFRNVAKEFNKIFFGNTED
jgi:hypothetical protein